MKAGVWLPPMAGRARPSARYRPIPTGSPARRSAPRRGPSRAVAKRAALAVSVIVADPHGDGDIVGEAYEPSVILVVGGAGLARHIGGEARDRPRRPPCQHALKHSLELVERGVIDRRDRRDRRFR